MVGAKRLPDKSETVKARSATTMVPSVSQVTGTLTSPAGYESTSRDTEHPVAVPEKVKSLGVRPYMATSVVNFNMYGEADAPWLVVVSTNFARSKLTIPLGVIVLVLVPTPS